MRTMVPVLVLLGVGLTIASPVASDEPDARPMVTAAERYVRSLSDAQRRSALLPFQSPNRFQWTFLPGRRLGLTLRQMTATQRESALALVRTGLSDDGWTRLQGIFTLETILQRNLSAARKRRDPTWRDPLGYTLTIFGRPTPDGTWGWRLGGHHVSLSFTVMAGTPVAATPFFLGGSPARVTRGPEAGLEPLSAQQDAGHALVLLLDARQRSAAVEAPRVPRGILLGPGRRTSDVRAAGIPAARLEGDQITAFWSLVSTFAGSLTQAVADRLLERARTADAKQLLFVWRGSTVAGQDHYFRVQGPTFVIEHWNQGNHIHSVWRDATDEFGAQSANRRTGR